VWPGFSAIARRARVETPAVWRSEHHFQSHSTVDAKSLKCLAIDVQRSIDVNGMVRTSHALPSYRISRNSNWQYTH
jgi:hypothetical protein